MIQQTRYGGLITQTKKSESGYFLLTRCIRLICLQIIRISYQQNKRRYSTKRIHTGRIFSKIESKHKKRAGGRYRLLFSVQKRLFATRGETDYETSNNSQKVKLIRRCFYFTTLLKKCQYVLHNKKCKSNASQNVSR